MIEDKKINLSAPHHENSPKMYCQTMQSIACSHTYLTFLFVTSGSRAVTIPTTEPTLASS